MMVRDVCGTSACKRPEMNIFAVFMLSWTQLASWTCLNCSLLLQDARRWPERVYGIGRLSETAYIDTNLAAESEEEKRNRLKEQRYLYLFDFFFLALKQNFSIVCDISISFSNAFYVSLELIKKRMNGHAISANKKA